ncbi:MAG: hypothetical protein HC828_10570 [Blastochloris sp.]|nr:hypothetical protein [Blastochloris sp.]
MVFSVYNTSNAWQNVTQWKLDYATAANSVKSDGENGQKMLTLLSVKQGGWNTSTWSYLPTTTFTYELNRGTTSPTPPTPSGTKRDQPVRKSPIPATETKPGFPSDCFRPASGCRFVLTLP